MNSHSEARESKLKVVYHKYSSEQLIWCCGFTTSNNKIVRKAECFKEEELNASKKSYGRSDVELPIDN